MNKDKLREQLEHHEAKRLNSYICPGGYLTVGVGRNLKTNPADEELGRKIDRVGMEISHDEAMMLLDNDIERFTHELRSSLPEFDSLSESRQQVLIDMAFNMGTHGLLGFQRMLSAIKEGDFDNAAEEMLDSRWASQVGDRAKRLARMMREDEAFANVV